MSASGARKCWQNCLYAIHGRPGTYLSNESVSISTGLQSMNWML
jgi:hypothetical protein